MIQVECRINHVVKSNQWLITDKAVGLDTGLGLEISVYSRCMGIEIGKLRLEIPLSLVQSGLVTRL